MLQLYVKDMKVCKSKLNRMNYLNIQTDAVHKEHFSEGEIKFQGCMAEHLVGFFVFLFLLAFSFTNIHNLQDRRRGGRLFLYHFYPLFRHLGISRAITAACSSLHIASSWTRAGNLDSNWEQQHFIGSVFVIVKNV